MPLRLWLGICFVLALSAQNPPPTDPQDLARSLTAASEAALSSGDYPASIQYSHRAIQAHTSLNQLDLVADDWNRIGLASTYTADYPSAINAYNKALALDRQLQDTEGEVVRLYNLGNVFFEQGRYQDAYRSYRASVDRVESSPQAPWYRHRRQIAVVNLAILYQRLGRYQQALALYQSLDNLATAIPPSQRAQILANQGTLFRRLGDPLKALDSYHQAAALFARERHPFGEVGVLKNQGIALALDLHRLPEALLAFQQASRLAASSAPSQLPSIDLFLAQALLQTNQPEAARRAFDEALSSARRQASKEYEWRALFGLGQLAALSGDNASALRLYSDAIRIFESLRSTLDITQLKREFLADKREVYDAAIHLLLQHHPPDTNRIFQLMENSRSRLLQDTLGANPSLTRIQQSLPPGTTLLEFWQSSTAAAVLAITPTSVQLHPRPAIDTSALRAALLNPTQSNWRPLAQQAASSLLQNIPINTQNLIIVPDGPLALIPFEALSLNGPLLLESTAVFYLPSAAILLRPNWGKTQSARGPWQPQATILADPAINPSRALLDAAYPPLPNARQEAQFIAATTNGRTTLHTAEAAQKTALQQALASRTPLLHISSHASVDYQDPERSRILLAPPSPSDGLDFLFLREVYAMNLAPIDLIVLSACDTETGKIVRGEGVEGFGRAFITAGAASALTTLWRVDDKATSQFMQQFYFHLAKGLPKAHALRQAKLSFLHSNTQLAHPAYWAAFVLNGDGLAPTIRFYSWYTLAAAGLALAAVAAFLIFKLRPTARNTRSNQ